MSTLCSGIFAKCYLMTWWSQASNELGECVVLSADLFLWFFLSLVISISKRPQSVQVDDDIILSFLWPFLVSEV